MVRPALVKLLPLLFMAIHATKPFFDSEAAVDYMVSRGFIDESRVAAAGGSYGGYLVNWIAGHSSKYKALISHAGVYNLLSQFASDSTLHRPAAYGGSPWQKKDKLQQVNPAMFAENFNIPMLVTPWRAGLPGAGDARAGTLWCS